MGAYTLMKREKDGPGENLDQFRIIFVENRLQKSISVAMINHACIHAPVRQSTKRK